MRVLLISANTERMNLPPLPLGLACVAAATQRAGHDVTLVNLMFEGDARSALRRSMAGFCPDVIGVSVRNIDDQNIADPNFLLPPVRKVVADCRSACDAPIVLGGAGYSIFPERCLHYLGADMGIQGEGESVFPTMLERMARGAPLLELPGVCLPGQGPAARSLVRNLDSLPLPEPGLWIPAGSGGGDLWVPVQTRRGCPMECTYCSTPIIEGRPIRRHSAEVIAAWLTELARAGHRKFNFVDNTFNLPPSYAEDLCRRIIQADIAIDWWCIVYPKWVDRRLVTLMAQAGCRQVSLGFESGSNRILKLLGKRFTSDDVRAVSKMLQDAGIERRGFLLLGGPGETKQTVEESLSFADTLNLDFLKVTVGLRIYPQTQLAARALAEGLIRADDDLLLPRFYLTPELRDWLPAQVAAYRASRSWVV